MKKILLFIRDIFEVYIPVASFIVMFIIFVISVFTRYILNYPISWSMEIIVICFIWLVIFGSCYTMRFRVHVKFTMIYDHLSPKPAAVFRMLGNIIIAVAFISIVFASYQFSLFNSFMKTAIFRISYTVMFLPFVYFLCSITGYTIMDIIEDIKVISGALPDSKDHEAAEALK